jgi:catechol 2,3-dioxygenase-like lactoylglutathione lyase family enzyme
MMTQIKHMAIASENYALMGRFYEALFHLRTSPKAKPESAVVVGDGYVGLNINPRRAGRQAGFDHFGFEVDDVETILARMKSKYPAVNASRRPGNRPFAGLSTHDPAGNVFDLSQKGMENRRDVYEDGEWKQDRTFHHLALRTVMPEALAQFYVDVFELRPQEKPAGDPNFYLSDGRITFVIMPWNINDYQGSGIERPAPEHIGFKVESVETFRKELDALIGRNPRLAPSPVGAGPEGAARLKLFQSSCPLGQYHLADPDGVLIDVSAA